MAPSHRAETIVQRVPQSSLQNGHWWAPCCIEDLQEIRTDEDLETAREFAIYAGGWTSLDEAIRDICSPQWPGEDVSEERLRASQLFPAATERVFGESPDV